MRVVYGARVAPALRRAVARVTERLEAHGVSTGADATVVAIGLDDPRLAARLPEGPRVVVPALGGPTLPPWGRALLSTADVVVVLDEVEIPPLAAEISAPVVVCGLPRSPVLASRSGLDPGEAPRALLELWRHEPGHGCCEPGIAWVAGGGAAGLAAAAEAWASGRAVVALRRVPPHAMLRRGGALRARTSLEALEATRFLCTVQPLRHALLDRGRRVVSRLDALDVVAERFAEAIVLAEEVGR